MEEENLKWKTIVCAVIFILVSVSVAPSINAEIDYQPLQTISDDNTFDYDGYTPIKLVFLLISKLLNHEQIQMVESVDDVEQLVKSDVELSGIFEELMSCSCGCEDSSLLEWNYPVICGIFFIPFLFCLGVWFVFFPIWEVLNIRIGFMNLGREYCAV